MTSLLGRRHFGCAFCAAAGALTTSCVSDGTTSPGALAPGYRPDAASDEGGLWATMDKAESELKRSRFVVRDAAINRYVGDIACRLGKDHCRDLRLYVIRTPVFNATMAPNGMMQVWTGLLLRVQDEAQLAAVIGHEMAHYLERHTLQRFRDIRAKADLATFLTMGLALAGPIGSVAGLAAQMALLASVFAFSREQERDADRIGSELMARAGFAPGRAADVWEQLIAELAVSTIPAERDPFSATHPDMSERVQNLRALAADKPGGEAAPDRLRLALASLRTTLFQDEIRLRQPARSLVVFDQLRRTIPEDAELAFYTGEVHRLRDQEGDNRLAREAYERAVALPKPPAEAYRSLGLVARRDGDTPTANFAFRRYLDLAPRASDRQIILSYITQTS